MAGFSDSCGISASDNLGGPILSVFPEKSDILTSSRETVQGCSLVYGALQMNWARSNPSIFSFLEFHLFWSGGNSLNFLIEE